MRFSLGKLVTVCPQCGHRTFKPYIDNATGQPLDENICGRCNREVNCAYHFPPSRWFAAGNRIEGNLKLRLNYAPPRPRLPDFVVLPPAESIERLRTDNLFCYLSLRFGERRVYDVFTDYHVVHSSWMGGATAFYLVDAENRARSAKVMRYGTDGHRLKGDEHVFTVNYQHSILHIKPFSYRACFFGENLAAKNPSKPIYIVESEKTALIMSCADRSERNIYLASGGCCALKPQLGDRSDPFSRFNILKGRCVTLIPDADMIAKWMDAAVALKKICSTVKFLDVTCAPFSLTGSQDIGDYVMERLPPQRSSL